MYCRITSMALGLLAAAALSACGGGDSDDGTKGIDPVVDEATAQSAIDPTTKRDATALRVSVRDSRLPDINPNSPVDRINPVDRVNPAPSPGPSPAPALPAAIHQLESLTLPGYPHAIDVYRPSGATRAIVFLHGGAGTQQTMAYQMGVKTTYEAAPTMTTVNWATLANAGVIAVFPQGQAMNGNARTWNNHAMDSGQDDVGFLRALSAALRARYAVATVSVAGHSMGGAMVNRMRCEAPEAFNAHVSFSGPASSYYLNADTPCARAGQSPYLGLFGSADTVIPGAWDAPTWLINPAMVGMANTPFVNPLMIGEWQAFQRRAQLMCGETPALASQIGSASAPRWSACGDRLQVQLAAGASHDLGSIASVIGTPPFQLVADFTAKSTAKG